MQESSRPEIKEVLKSAAWRFFEILDLAKENEDALKEKRKKEGLTLDNMFGVENHFLEVIHLVLTWHNEDSLKLAETILDEKYYKNFLIFKRSLGDAFRIAGNHKATKYHFYITV